MLSPRGAYINLLTAKRNSSVEKARNQNMARNHSRQIKKKIGTEKSFAHRSKSKPKTQRERTFISTSPNRQSTLRFECQRTNRHSKLKSNMNSWSKTCISLQKNQKVSHEEEMRKNQEGKNCRIVILNNGKTQQEHFLSIHNLSDIPHYLKKTFKRINYFYTVPRQIPLEFILSVNEQISGQFLNGQSLYLKPQTQVYQKQQEVTIQDFQIIKQIGSGGFSKVFLVRNKIDHQFYAMKLIEKQMVVRNKKKKIVMNERNIMVNSKHPFLVELKHAFQCKKYIVFIMEYCVGGQLFGLIKKYRRLNEDVAKFYIIEILLGLAYLHSQNVVYRDIKPENILLDIQGHVKIADLGLAKPNMTNGELAYSFCGSPQYMSPEMIMQVGHTYPVDYYCMGALLYELLFGLPPFYSQNPNQIYESVLTEDIFFPEDVEISKDCKSLLKSLLCKDPKHRLGSLYGTKQILAHPWFGKQDYELFILKKISSPINFKKLQKIDLDSNSQKHKESLEKVIKDQKFDCKSKDVLKNFYFTSPNENDPRAPLTQRRNCRKNVKSASQKQSKSSRNQKKKMGSGVSIRTPLQAILKK